MYILLYFYTIWCVCLLPYIHSILIKMIKHICLHSIELVIIFFTFSFSFSIWRGRQIGISLACVEKFSVNTFFALFFFLSVVVNLSSISVSCFAENRQIHLFDSLSQWPFFLFLFLCNEIHC